MGNTTPQPLLRAILMMPLLVIACPASAVLEDSYTTGDKEARKNDPHNLVLTLRRPETANGQRA